jgi:hypothetical protein
MAYSPSGYNPGPGIVIPAQSIYETSTTAKHKLGDRLQLGGRVFYYASAGAALVAGRLCETATLMGALTTVQSTQAVSVAAVAGDRKLYLTATTTEQTAGLYEDGYVAIEDVTVTYASYLYRIKTNTAIATSGTASYLTLYDPLHIALTTSDKVSLCVNPFKSVVTCATTQLGVPIGVAPVAVASGSYCWLQTWGPCSIFSHDGGLAIGAALVPASTTAGDFLAQAGGSTCDASPQVASGVFYTVADEDAGIVMLAITP